MGMIKSLEGGPDPIQGDWRGVLTQYRAPGGSGRGVLDPKVGCWGVWGDPDPARGCTSLCWGVQ